MFISWQENLTAEEQPPKRIWLDTEALQEHFARVRTSRGEGRDDWGHGEIEDPVQNEFAAELKRKLRGG